MQKYSKSISVFYFNLIVSIVILSASVLCFTKINETVFHLGIDLYLIFGFVFLVFSFPFVLSLIRYLILPKTVITINKDELIIHKKKSEIHIPARKLIGVSKIQTFNLIYGLDIGTLKVLIKNSEKPIIIRSIDEVDKAYQTLNILILRQFEYYNQ